MECTDNIILYVISGICGIFYFKGIISLLVVPRFARIAYHEGGARSHSGLINFVYKKSEMKVAFFLWGRDILKEYGKNIFIFICPIIVLLSYLLFSFIPESSPSEILFWSPIISFLLALFLYFRAKKGLRTLGFIGVLKT